MIKTPRKPPKSDRGATQSKKPKKIRTRTQKSLKKELWSLVSRYVRMSAADRNGNCTCYTCGTVGHWKEMQAGHGVSGRGNAILFELKVIRPQCYPCNMHKHGNYEVFIPKLVHEIGLDEYEDLVVSKSIVRKLFSAWYLGEIAFYKARIDEIILDESIIKETCI
jgi:hypothetical protein